MELVAVLELVGIVVVVVVEVVVVGGIVVAVEVLAVAVVAVLVRELVPVLGGVLAGGAKQNCNN